MTPFRFEHDFRAPSTALVLAAYFDPALVAEHDRLSGIARREELAHDDTPARLTATSRAYPERQLPAFMRPFVAGPLHFVQHLVWDKAADRLDLDIRPSILGKRTQIRVVYTVALVAPGVVRRVYEGDATVEIALVGGRVERAIVDDIARTLERVVPCTQEWLDAHTPGV